MFNLKTYVLIAFVSCFSKFTQGQVLDLKVIAEDNLKTSIIDSLNYNKHFEDYSSLKKEVDSLNLKLNRLGYIEAALKHLIKKNDTLFSAEFALGNRAKGIQIYYDDNFNKNLLSFIDHKNGDGFFELNISTLENTLNIINAKMAEDGNPFSTLQLENIRKGKNNLIIADLNIKTKQKRRIDNIIVKGYEKFPKSYLKHFIKLKKGNVLNLTDIKDRIELFEDLRFANKIREPEVLFTKDSTSLYLYIEKSKSNTFDGFLGFGTNENTNKLEFDGYLDLNLTNNLNYGETFNLYYKNDEIDQQTFRADATLPYILGSPIGLEVGLNIFRKDTTFSNVTQNIKVNYQISSKHKVSAGLRSITSSNLLENDTEVLNNYKSNYYILSYNFNKPQYYDLLFPINFSFDISAGFGNRSFDSGELTQSVFNINTYKIFNLNERNSIFTRLSGAVINSDSYLDNELFRFGGINSIRGFEENSLVANLFGVLNTEYRYRLSNTIYVHSVIDAAYFENQINTAQQNLFGFGFGFGLLTKAGLFRFNYTTAKTEDSAIKLSDSKIHVSLTANF